MAKTARSEKFYTPTFRVSFPHLDKPNKMEGSAGDPKYSVAMIFDVAAIKKDPKQKKLYAAMEKAVKDVIQEHWNGKPPKGLKNPLRDGAEKDHLGGYGEGKTFASASTKYKPGLVNRSARNIEADELYAGCYAHATVSAYAYDVSGNRGVAFGLNHIQKKGDGDPLSGGSSAFEDFEELEDEEVIDDDDIFGDDE